MGGGNLGHEILLENSRGLIWDIDKLVQESARVNKILRGFKKNFLEEKKQKKMT